VEIQRQHAPQKTEDWFGGWVSPIHKALTCTDVATPQHHVIEEEHG
jgi:hypothetical protein